MNNNTLLKKLDFTDSEIERFVFNKANRRILDYVRTLHDKIAELEGTGVKPKPDIKIKESKPTQKPKQANYHKSIIIFKKGIPTKVANGIKDAVIKARIATHIVKGQVLGDLGPFNDIMCKYTYDTDLRYCASCQRFDDKRYFRHNSKGHSVGQCSECHSLKERERRKQ